MKLNETYDVFLRKTEHWINQTIDHLPNIALAFVVLFLFIAFSKLITNLFRRLFFRGLSSKAVVRLLSLFISRSVAIIGFFVFLNILGLEKAVSSLLAGAGIVGLALGFAFQDLTANFISGIFIVAGEPIRPDDVVETNGYTGKVKAIRLRSILLDNGTGQYIELPSRKIIENPIINYTKLKMRRVEISCSVSYDDDLSKVEKVVRETVENLRLHMVDKPVEVHFTRFADSGINFVVWLWIDLADHTHPGIVVTTSTCIKAIKKAFADHQMTIPYPTTVEIQKDNAT